MNYECFQEFSKLIVSQLGSVCPLCKCTCPEHSMNFRIKMGTWNKSKLEAQQSSGAVRLLLIVLAPCPGTAGSLLGAAFLAAKAAHALCHSRGAALPNCLFSTILSSISLLTAPLQSENANKDRFSCQISGNHIAPGTTVWKFVRRVLCQERDSIHREQAQS